MKNCIILLAAWIFVSIPASAQNQPDKEAVYYEASPLTIFRLFDLTNTRLTDTYKRTYSTLAFKLNEHNPIQVNNTPYYILKFYDIKATSETNINPEGKSLTGNAAFINSKDNGYYFCIPVDSFGYYLDNGQVEKKYRVFKKPELVLGGNLSTPFKYRPKVGEHNYVFSPEISLGFFFGPKWRLSHTQPFYLTIPLCAGFSGIPLSNNSSDTTEKGNLAFGFSVSSGVVFQFKDFQIGFLLGGDFVGGDAGKAWLYNNMIWYSASIGYNFITTPTREKKEAAKDKKIKEEIQSTKVDQIDNLRSELKKAKEDAQ